MITIERHVRLWHDDGWHDTLENVFFVPQLCITLFSVQKRCEVNFIPVYKEERDKIIIKERMGEGAVARLVQVVTTTKRKLMRPTLDCTVVMWHSLPSPHRRMHEALRAHLSTFLLHKRLGHSRPGAFVRLIREKMMDGVENVVERDLGVCAPCKLGKMTRHPHPAVEPAPIVEGPLNLVVMDMVGPNKHTFDKAAYDLVLVYVFKRRFWVFLLKNSKLAAGCKTAMCKGAPTLPNSRDLMGLGSL